jgi:hypothetical protein
MAKLPARIAIGFNEDSLEKKVMADLSADGVGVLRDSSSGEVQSLSIEDPSAVSRYSISTSVTDYDRPLIRLVERISKVAKRTKQVGLQDE